jgi:hypothetical protein
MKTEYGWSLDTDGLHKPSKLKKMEIELQLKLCNCNFTNYFRMYNKLVG